MRLISTKATLLLIPILLTGCAWSYHADVNQGNYITQETASQLEVGMTREQVMFVMGSPLAGSPFRTERWDYIYNLESKESGNRRAYLVVWFTDDRVVRIETREAPSI